MWHDVLHGLRGANDTFRDKWRLHFEWHFEPTRQWRSLRHRERRLHLNHIWRGGQRRERGVEGGDGQNHFSRAV
ncbi:hypothetical protein KL86PLE_90756 [uncultured Pleomorphomonas sp.]|uniref:Uncharacterized protein n=1 Tax=uncultured Pleomorphomonas sp. TaxID=442121 RepID=A0A212LR54_9HYPH|nr:hypothetical protein KL86PLE_90756 [uncultured Pleomorphomonas sp.]